MAFDKMASDIYKVLLKQEGLLDHDKPLDFATALSIMRESIVQVEKAQGLSGEDKKKLVLAVLQSAVADHPSDSASGQVLRLMVDFAPTLIDELVAAFNSPVFLEMKKRAQSRCKKGCF